NPSIGPGDWPALASARWTDFTSAPLVPGFSTPAGRLARGVDCVGAVAGAAGAGVVACLVVVGPVVGGAELLELPLLLKTPDAASTIRTSAMAAAPNATSRPRDAPAKRPN